MNGRDLAEALWRAEELETLAAQHWRALAIVGPVVLPAAEIARVQQRFGTYGPRRKPAADGSEG